jgi:hypothetical protein
MRRIIALPFFCLLVVSVTAGCVARVGYVAPAPAVVVAAPAPAVVVAAPAPAPVAEVAVEAPPPIAIAEPELVVVPGGNEYVYMVPNVAGVYFYNGLWYRYYGGAWFSASVWGTPWIGIAAAPGIVIGIDPFYPFYLPVGYFRIGWGDFHSHWRSWGHDHYWHNNTQFRHEMRSDVRNARMNRINQDRRTGKISRFDNSGKVSGSRGFSKPGAAGTQKFNKPGQAGAQKFNKPGAQKGMTKQGPPKPAPKAHAGSREHTK